jgi:hypothetical protein
MVMPASSSGTPPCIVFRHRIERCAVPTDLNLPPHKRFFPKSKVTALCTAETVTEVLSCWCPSCTCHIQTARHLVAEHTTAAGRLICADDGGVSFVITFCLLVYIKCPQLIRHILCNNSPLTDEILETGPNTPSVDFIRRNAWPDFDDAMRHESNEFAHDLRWNKYKFFVPALRSQSFTEYESSTILPFVDEEPIWRKTETGETIQEHGAFGRVFSFRIVPEYNALRASGIPRKGVAKSRLIHITECPPYHHVRTERVICYNSDFVSPGATKP